MSAEHPPSEAAEIAEAEQQHEAVMEHEAPSFYEQNEHLEIEIFGIKGPINKLIGLCPIDQKDMSSEARDRFTAKAMQESGHVIPKEHAHLLEPKPPAKKQEPPKEQEPTEVKRIKPELEAKLTDKAEKPVIAERPLSKTDEVPVLLERAAEILPLNQEVIPAQIVSEVEIVLAHRAQEFERETTKTTLSQPASEKIIKSEGNLPERSADTRFLNFVRLSQLEPAKETALPERATRRPVVPGPKPKLARPQEVQTEVTNSAQVLHVSVLESADAITLAQEPIASKPIVEASPPELVLVTAKIEEWYEESAVSLNAEVEEFASEFGLYSVVHADDELGETESYEPSHNIDREDPLVRAANIVQTHVETLGVTEEVVEQIAAFVAVLPADIQVNLAECLQSSEPEAVKEIESLLITIAQVSGRLHVLSERGEAEGEESMQIEKVLIEQYAELLAEMGLEVDEQACAAIIERVRSESYGQNTRQEDHAQRIIDEGLHEHHLSEKFSLSRQLTRVTSGSHNWLGRVTVALSSAA